MGKPAKKRTSLWLGVFAAAPFFALAVVLLLLALKRPEDVSEELLPHPRGQLYMTDLGVRRAAEAAEAGPGAAESDGAERGGAPVTMLGGTDRPKAAVLRYDALVEPAAERHGVPADLVRAVIQTESAGNPHAVSVTGARGLMQLMPATARHLNVRNSFDAEQNIDGGVRYLKQLSERFDGDLVKTVAAYNAGPGAVQRYGGAVPPYTETQNYVRKVLRLYASFSNQNEEATPQTATATGPRPLIEIVEDPASFLHWPASGPVVRIVKPKGQARETGVDIRVAPGASVRAASDGRVIAVGKSRNGKKSITIQHDDRYTTTYAHLAVILVGVNDLVAAGDVIGSAALDKGRTASLLRFDLRENNKPRSPADFRWRGVKPTTPSATLASTAESL